MGRDLRFRALSKSSYLSKRATHAGDKRFLREMYQQHIAENDFIHDLYEDQHAQWSDDLDAAQMMTAKVLSSWKEGDVKRSPYT